ncbi:hypothetical protein FKM82_004474 [Ascaphus truei]
MARYLLQYRLASISALLTILVLVGPAKQLMADSTNTECSCCVNIMEFYSYRDWYVLWQMYRKQSLAQH